MPLISNVKLGLLFSTKARRQKNVEHNSRQVSKRRFVNRTVKNAEVAYSAFKKWHPFLQRAAMLALQALY